MLRKWKSNQDAIIQRYRDSTVTKLPEFLAGFFYLSIFIILYYENYVKQSSRK